MFCCLYEHMYIQATEHCTRVSDALTRSQSYDREFQRHRGPFLSSSLAPRGALGPQGEICPLEVKFTPLFTPGVNTLYCLEEWRGKQRISPQEITSPLGDKIHLRGTTSSLGVKVCP
jgi:hypothetical protein